MKTGVAAALARYRGEARYAVVFDARDWWPFQPPAGEEWDYEPHATLETALEAARGMTADADAEVWQRGGQGWERVAYDHFMADDGVTVLDNITPLRIDGVTAEQGPPFPLISVTKVTDGGGD